MGVWSGCSRETVLVVVVEEVDVGPGVVRLEGGDEASRPRSPGFSALRSPRAELEAIDIRTSLIWGRHDPVVRLPAVEKVAARYRWPLRVIDDAGHLPQLEQPAAVLDALRASIAPRE